MTLDFDRNGCKRLLRALAGAIAYQEGQRDHWKFVHECSGRKVMGAAARRGHARAVREINLYRAIARRIEALLVSTRKTTVLHDRHAARADRVANATTTATVRRRMEWKRK